MNYNTFFQLIKNDSLSGAYLMHGSEEFVKDRALERILSGLDETLYELNVQILREPDVQSIITACESLPFLAQKRIVICRDFVFSEISSLANYFPSIPETTLLLLFCRGNADKRTTIYQKLEKQNRVAEFAPLSEADAVKWIMQQSHRLSVAIDEGTARHLTFMVGCDVSRLNQELTKAADYVGPEGTINQQVLLKSVHPNAEYLMFDIYDDLLAGKKIKALTAMHALVRDGSSSPLGIASYLAGRLKLALIAKRCEQLGYSQSRTNQAIGAHQNAVKSARLAARQKSMEEIEAGIAAFSNVDLLQKTGAANDFEMLELTILRYFS